MAKQTPAAPEIDTSHWAHRQGRLAGLSGNTTERGLMAFGLGCAGDSTTVKNTRHWLAGFDAGMLEAAELKAAARPTSGNAWGDDGMRRYGQGRCA